MDKKVVDEATKFIEDQGANAHAFILAVMSNTGEVRFCFNGNAQNIKWIELCLTHQVEKMLESILNPQPLPPRPRPAAALVPVPPQNSG